MEPRLSTPVDVRSLLGPQLWRATEQAPIRTASTGFEALDRLLPGRGWPIGAVSEILSVRIGSGEMSLSLPLLARLTQGGSPVALIDPPHRPHAPRLQSSGIQLTQLLVLKPDSIANGLWSAELLLRAGGSILMWAAGIESAALRRLQLAAESSDSFALLIRPEAYASESTTSALRLRIWREHAVPRVEVLKCRGARPAAGKQSTLQSGHNTAQLLNPGIRPAA